MSDKKQSRVSIRFGEELYRLAIEMQKAHGATDISDYVRGLILEKAVEEGRSVKGLDLPGWLVGSSVHISRTAPAKDESPKAPAAKR